MKLKEYIKSKLQNNYKQFMIDICNINLTIDYISKKYNIPYNTIRNWKYNLGHKWDFTTHMQLRNQYKRLKKIKERQKKVQTLIDNLKNNKIVIK